MGARHSRLAAALAASWEAELVSARRLSELAERVASPDARARLLVLSSFCRAHASRVLARLAALGRGPLPVPPEDLGLDDHSLKECLEQEVAQARAHAQRYLQMADLARQQADLSSAWICELNRSEAEELAREILRLLAEDRVVETRLPAP